MDTGFKDMQNRTPITSQERDHIARKLHDTVGQLLNYINMQLNALKKLANSNQIEKLENNLDAISKIVEEATNEMCENIYEVRKSLILKDGFFPTLDQYLLRFEEIFNINVDIQNH